METSLVIYFEPPLKLKKDAGRIKRIFIQHGSEFHSKPHITLYLARFSRLNFLKLLVKLKKIKLKKFIFTITSIKREKKFFYINIGKTRGIIDIHKEILELAGPLHDKNLRSNFVKRKKEGKFSKRELELLHRYGTAMVLDYFLPHITLGGYSLDASISESELKDLYKKAKTELSHIKGKEYLVDKITLIFSKKYKLGRKKIIFKKNIYLD